MLMTNRDCTLTINRAHVLIHPLPVCLPNRPDLLTQTFNGSLHRDLQNLNLHALLLEPRLFGSRVSLTKWQQELKHLKDSLPDLFMKQSGPFLFNGARRIRWTSIHHLWNKSLIFSCSCFRTESYSLVP